MVYMFVQAAPRVTNLSCKMTTESVGSVLVNGRCVPSVSVSPPTTNIPPKMTHITGEASGESVEPVSVESKQDEAYPPVLVIKHGLDELSLTGTTINNLVVEMTRTRELYRQVLQEGSVRVDSLRRKLYPHIVKSEPFFDLHRKGKQVHAMSNKAAARYDKASSQYAAAKEMIRVAEFQLASCREEQYAAKDSSSPSPIDAAWQEMLNHATGKVVLTEKERRDSEMEHQKVLEECTRIHKQCQLVKRKLHSHITKSWPYYKELSKVRQQLFKLKVKIKELEKRISESKQKYAASLKHLDLLSTDMHIRRGTLDRTHLNKSALDSRKTQSTGNTPEMKHKSEMMDLGLACMMDNVSVDSWQMSDSGGQFSGSTGSLPSLDTEHCPSPQEDQNKSKLQHSSSFSSSSSFSPSPPSSTCIPYAPPTSVSSKDNSPAVLEQVASELVVQCLSDAVSQVELTTENSVTNSDNSPAVLEQVASELVVQCLGDAVSQAELTTESSFSSSDKLEQVASELVVQCLGDAVSQVELTTESSFSSSDNSPGVLEQVTSELL